MGLLDGLRAMIEPLPAPVVQRSEADFDTLVEEIAQLLEDRLSAFTLAQALQLPPVIRGVSLIAGVGASMLPLAYQSGRAMAAQPRIVRKPDPFATRYTFVYQTLEALIADRYGEAFWLLTDHDGRGHPRAATVLPNDDVRVSWDARGWRPRYHWRDRELVADVEIKHIAPNRKAGQLHGRGPVQEALRYLYPVHEAESYAASFFASGGLPMTVLNTAQKLNKEEAAKLKKQWMESRADPSAPAVASGDVSAEFPAIDPQKSQMTEARGAGAAIVARILGIPGALLHVETSGATITYTNPEGALEELVKTTVAPIYLAPLEQAWSELVPAPQAVRFDLADMQRAAIGARFALYAQAIGTVDEAGEPLMTTAEARAFEGWGPSSPDTAHSFDPEPAVKPATVEIPA